MSLIPPYPVTSHALSSSSLPQPIADLISELLKDNQTLDGQRSLLVCSAAASIQRRLGMAAVCAERDLGSMTSLLSNLVRSCMVGLPVYIRERVRIALPRHPAAAIGDPLAQLLPDYLQVALLVFFAFVPQSKLDSMSANPTATTSQKTDTRYADVGASESSGASFVRNDDSDDDVEWTMEDLARGYRVASDDRTRTIASAVSSDQWFSPRGQNFSSNLFTEDLNGYKIDTVLVMAEKGTIYSALAGALYHRRALGFPSDSPVLGLVYSTSSHGTWLHVVFAWLDETSQVAWIPLSNSLALICSEGKCQRRPRQLREPGWTRNFRCYRLKFMQAAGALPRFRTEFPLEGTSRSPC
ncbi:hypothetical protein FA95DRAFT_1103899 [Auriscalpium vulgare]|uniref:Uncharacterized protein n=1 Tax=Auriscalpium vulgare TaxID=40419 RepID=A0ACB8R587_9AGAM|nr:hypothetical protein FA95DRAFT_1103899 [Auriscalpium vulgare]